jgi:hypothetical protein
MKTDLHFVLISLLFAALFAVTSFGQATSGTLDIMTKDANGAVVPGVTLTVINTAEGTGYKRTVTTNDDGFARILQIPPGTYSMTAWAMKGFAERSLINIDVVAGRTTSLPLNMLVASPRIEIETGVEAIGHYTPGVLEITTKDPNGAIVPGVTLTITGTGEPTNFKRTVTTDDKGFARLLQVPPGTYSITAATLKGFAEKTLTSVQIGSGRTTVIDFEMMVGSTLLLDCFPPTTQIDTTSTTSQSSVSSRTEELPVPKGLNYSSILRLAPPVRLEPRSGQFQIDGASGSENTFFIDGLEVTNVLTGRLDANNDLPHSQLQEVKVKFGGIDAEYAGATGGVIQVVTKAGGNAFHGEFGMGLRSSKLEPIAGPTLRLNNGQPQYYPNRRDLYNETNPSFNLGGPIMKDHVWFFATYAPQLFSQSRTLVFRDFNGVPTGRVETYRLKQRKEAAFGRLDAMISNKLQLTGTVNWNPITQEGQIPSYTSELNVNTASGAALSTRGGRQNSMNYGGQGTYLVTNDLIVSARAGHNFLNEKLGTYGIGSIVPPRIVCVGIPFSPTPFPQGFGCTILNPPGPPAVGPVSNTEYDATTRDQFDGDATYSFTGGGRHELKGGYQYSKAGNKVLMGTTDLISLRSGTTGLATVGAYSGRSIPSTPGAIGSGRLSTFRTRGDVSSVNHSVYIQDGWQVTRRLRLNLGVRAESEDVPSYAPGLAGINFDWGSKVAPRLGAAYDLTGDGKTKVSAFYGLYYDRFKLSLPRGSFGGDEFHDIYFEFFPGDTIYTINRDLIFGPGNSPIPGGACPLNTLTPVYGRVRCDIDFRISANSGSPLNEVGGVDPNIKPFEQREIMFGFERQLSRNYIAAARYTRKQVIHAIEDAGFPNSFGSEYYIIGNPGEGLYKQQADAFGLLALKPQRQYDALELRLDKRFADDYYFGANYTYSRLYGNYSGLASSDEEGRSTPNITRYFDQPHAGFTVAGGPNNGRLATDRPHVFKLYGAYVLGWDKLGLWKSNSTDFSVFTTAQSGTVITSFIDLNNVQQIVLTKRGDQGRTPTFTQTDLAVHHSIRFGPNERFTLKVDADVLNAFNQHIVTNLGLNPSGQGGNIINLSNFNPFDPRFNLVSPAQQTACNGEQQCLLLAAYRTFQLNGSPELLAAAQGVIGHNSLYNLPSAYQAKRTIRYGIRFIF